MLFRINTHYFSLDPDHFPALVTSLVAAKPFVSYPGFTRVESNGQNTSLELDGRSTFLPNSELSAYLVNVQKELAAGSPGPSAYSSPMP